MIIGFIGAGNMASAILSGVLTKKLVPAEHIWMSNRSAGKLDAPASLGVHTTTDNRIVAQSADVIILAVKPQMFDDVLPCLAPYVAGKCVVSIAAGISVAFLEQQLPGALVMRAMPNTPMQVGLGMTALVAAPKVPPETFEAVRSLFCAAGEVAVIAEEQIDTIIAVSGSTPAFFFRMVDVIVSCAVRDGLDPRVALQMAAKTMEGSAAMLLAGKASAQELTAQVCSPGGTTLAALSAFDEADFEGMLTEAVARCKQRSKELGR